MPELLKALIYLACFATSSACAWLLARSYARTRARLLFWSACCFSLLALNNLIVVLDLLVFPERNFSLPRLATSLAAVGVLLFGFIWDMEE